MTIAQTSIDTLRKTLRGSVIVAGDPAYDEARRVWNAMIDKHPAVIARCRGAVDVMTAVTFARNEGLSIAVRGGAHNVAGKATCDDGIVIDLSEMKGIRVDPVAQHGARGTGAALGRVRPRDAGVRPRDDRRHDRRYRHRRPHARRRLRLARRPPRDDGRQPAGRRHRARQRRARPRERHREPRSLLGHPRRRQQLRRRHLVRIPAAPNRADDRRRPRDPPVRARGGSADVLRPVHARRARRSDRGGRAHDGPGWTEGMRDRRSLRWNGRRRREGTPAAQGVRAAGRSTSSGRYRMSDSSHCSIRRCRRTC